MTTEPKTCRTCGDQQTASKALIHRAARITIATSVLLTALAAGAGDATALVPCSLLDNRVVTVQGTQKVVIKKYLKKKTPSGKKKVSLKDKRTVSVRVDFDPPFSRCSAAGGDLDLWTPWTDGAWFFLWEPVGTRAISLTGFWGPRSTEINQYFADIIARAAAHAGKPLPAGTTVTVQPSFISPGMFFGKFNSDGSRFRLTGEWDVKVLSPRKRWNGKVKLDLSGRVF